MEFRITILGSSSALPTSTRHPSAHVLKAHERFFLIDCGEGTQMQLRKNRIRIGKIHDIFISHLHGDHIFGLYGLLSTLNLMGRKVPVTLYAPASFEMVLHSHLDDFDIHLGYDLKFVPLSGKKPKTIFEDKNIKVTTIPLIHRVPTYGFIFREIEKPRNIIREMITEYSIPLASIVKIKRGDDFNTADGRRIPNSKLTTDPPKVRSFAYCSDTLYFKGLADIVKGVDLLYHEATFGSDNQKLATDTMHSTAKEAASIALNAGVGQLVIGHFSSRYKEIQQLLDEAQSVFKDTEAAYEGLTINIE